MNEIAAGNPAFPAARAMPIASSGYVIVIAVTMSAAVSANVWICVEWYASASAALSIVCGL